MNYFEAEFNRLLGIEGDYSDHKSDRGGKTRYGVTEALARRYGYTGDMKDLPLSFAKMIFRAEFWDKLQLDAVVRLSRPVASELFDTGVNCGAGNAAAFLQRSLNAFNHQQADYPDTEVDGDLGPQTLACLSNYFGARPDGEVVLLRALNALQGAYYIQISQSRPANEDFVYGWFQQRVAI